MLSVNVTFRVEPLAPIFAAVFARGGFTPGALAPDALDPDPPIFPKAPAGFAGVHLACTDGGAAPARGAGGGRTGRTGRCRGGATVRGVLCFFHAARSSAADGGGGGGGAVFGAGGGGGGGGGSDSGALRGRRDEDIGVLSVGFQ